MADSTVETTVTLTAASGASINLAVRAGATLSEVCAVLDVLAGALKYGKDRYNLTPAPAPAPAPPAPVAAPGPALGTANGHPANGAAPTAAAPVCEFHGPMKPSSKVPGQWFCSAKMGDGSYCKSKA